MRMRKLNASFAVVLALVCVCAIVACKEPTKPIKKINIKKAEDFEPVSGPATATVASEQKAENETSTQSGQIEIVEVQDFKGACDNQFVGVNIEDLVTVRSQSQVRTFRLAGISIPEQVRPDTHNQIRFWLDKKTVSIEVDDSVPALDPAAYVYLCPDGTMINEELVRAGLALPASGTFRRSDVLKKASVEALSGRRGVWGQKAE